MVQWPHAAHLPNHSTLPLNYLFFENMEGFFLRKQYRLNSQKTFLCVGPNAGCWLSLWIRRVDKKKLDCKIPDSRSNWVKGSAVSISGPSGRGFGAMDTARDPLRQPLNKRRFFWAPIWVSQNFEFLNPIHVYATPNFKHPFEFFPLDTH